MTVPALKWKRKELIDQVQSIEDAINLKPQIVTVALAAVDTGGGVGAWQNPESVPVIIRLTGMHITTQSSGACTVDVGTTATSATTSSDNLIDGVSVATAGWVSNGDDAGTNGKKDQLLAAGKWVTFSVSSGASAGLAGYGYIEYIKTAARATGALDLSL